MKVQHMPHFILYSRSYCHLCHDMEQALQAWRERFAFTLDVRDVDQEPQAVALYDELVPVLLGQIGAQPPQQLCHYFLDVARIEAFLQSGVVAE
jgi:hypothetical protein